MILILPLKKAFVKSHMRSGKMVNSYFDKREKKVTHVKHSKKTRVDYSEKDAKSKIQFLEAKKNHHNSQVEAAKELKEKVESHKAKGNTTFKMGDKHHDISKVTKDLNDHINHHSNEVESHDNHISKIKDRYKTDREYFTNKNSKRIIGGKEPQKNDSPVLKLEKEGMAYTIHYPMHQGGQGKIEKQTLKQVKDFFKRWTRGPDDFEGKEFLEKKGNKSVYKIEKIGSSDRYNFYYPDNDGNQASMEKRPLGQIKMFFKMGRATGPIPDQFKGMEHVKGLIPKKKITKKILVPKEKQVSVPNREKSRGQELLDSGKGKKWKPPEDRLIGGFHTRVYFSTIESERILDEAGMKPKEWESPQIYYDINNKKWESRDISARKLSNLNEYLEPKTKEQKKVEKSVRSNIKQAEIEKYGVKPKALTGTVKQKSWATTIRSKILDSGSLTKEHTKSLLTAGGFTNSAKFWIENRNVQPSEFTAENIVSQYRGLQKIKKRHADSYTNLTHVLNERRKEIKDYLESSTFKFESDLI